MFVDVRVSLNDGVRAGISPLDSFIHHPHTEAHVQNVATAGADHVRMCLHQGTCHSRQVSDTFEVPVFDLIQKKLGEGEGGGGSGS